VVIPAITGPDVPSLPVILLTFKQDEDEDEDDDEYEDDEDDDEGEEGEEYDMMTF